MKKSKNAVSTTSALLTSVVMLAVLISIVMIPRMVGNAAESGADLYACKKSLDMSEGIKVVSETAADEMGNLARIDCSTRYTSTSSTKEALTQEFAESIFACWNLYHERMKLFDQSEGTYCIICESITVKSSDGITSPLFDYFRSKRIPTGKENYIETFGSANIQKGGPNDAEAAFNIYRFSKGDTIDVIVTFGDKGFNGKWITFNYNTGIGVMLHPHNDVGSLGCHTFEGRSTSLEYRR